VKLKKKRFELAIVLCNLMLFSFSFLILMEVDMHLLVCTVDTIVYFELSFFFNSFALAA